MSETTQVNVGEAKRIFSDLLARVAYGGETIVITRRGRPMPRLVPPTPDQDSEHLANVRGWLDEDDPYFEAIDEIVAGRVGHVARAPRETGRIRTRRSARAR